MEAPPRARRLRAMERAKVLVAGGGVAALEGALALQALGEGTVDVELVAPNADFAYRPLLVAEPFGGGSARTFPLRRLAEAAGASLREATVTGVDCDAHTVSTTAGDELPFDLLLLALGAVPVTAVPGTLCFRGPHDAAALARVVQEAAEGRVESIVFAAPPGTTWSLPVYELALQTRAELVDRGTTGVHVAVVTAEESPLGLFGAAASSAIAELLEARGIELHRATAPVAFADGVLRTAPTGEIAADRAFALPRLEGPRLAGFPSDGGGFIPVDEHCQVTGEIDVWAAGDATAFPLKQGGIAALQADAAAEAIAARAGAELEPQPFRPVLRGLLLTGMAPRYLRHELAGASSTIDTEPLWWPPAKIVGRYLAPFLAAHAGISEEPPGADRGALQIEVELAPERPGAWSSV